MILNILFFKRFCKIGGPAAARARIACQLSAPPLPESKGLAAPTSTVLALLLCASAVARASVRGEALKENAGDSIFCMAFTVLLRNCEPRRSQSAKFTPNSSQPNGAFSIRNIELRAPEAQGASLPGSLSVETTTTKTEEVRTSLKNPHLILGARLRAGAPDSGLQGRATGGGLAAKHASAGRVSSRHLLDHLPVPRGGAGGGREGFGLTLARVHTCVWHRRANDPVLKHLPCISSGVTSRARKCS